MLRTGGEQHACSVRFGPAQLSRHPGGVAGTRVTWWAHDCNNCNFRRSTLWCYITQLLGFTNERYTMFTNVMESSHIRSLAVFNQ